MGSLLDGKGLTTSKTMSLLRQSMKGFFAARSTWVVIKLQPDQSADVTYSEIFPNAKKTIETNRSKAKKNYEHYKGVGLTWHTRTLDTEAREDPFGVILDSVWCCLLTPCLRTRFENCLHRSRNLNTATLTFCRKCIWIFQFLKSSFSSS